MWSSHLQSICLMLIKRCLFSSYCLNRNHYLSNDIVVCSCYVFEVQVAWLFFSFNLYTVICYLCIPRPWRILIPKDTQKFMARIPQDAKNDWLIWRCFCRMSCSCDFCGCPCGCFLKMHISFSLCCALQKNLFYLSGHIKARAWLIFNLGFLFCFFLSGTHY